MPTTDIVDRLAEARDQARAAHKHAQQRTKETAQALDRATRAWAEAEAARHGLAKGDVYHRPAGEWRPAERYVVVGFYSWFSVHDEFVLGVKYCKARKDGKPYAKATWHELRIDTFTRRYTPGHPA